MKDGASRKKLSPRDIRYQKRAQSKDVPEETKLSNDEDPLKMVVAPPIQESLFFSHLAFQRPFRWTLWKLGQKSKMLKTLKT